ncbi:MULTISPECIES: PAAR domain-containing protein [unclassified Acinetobacter]|uniref:PAAR domain-containing protein n=1 Tax=unclassified Acinetobacter TaxID=196816 RepID=UPI001F4B708C|nr:MULTISPECIES: PAAR domain-containing protein [unclassified Acinetobacter]MCH7350412.1 PAAR domain-containing protein [Acinetobacter sp. NIPH 2023]MCH7357948.1 PAAR domain-containing protein [Acinetobacter sp. NIPH 2024]
MAKGFAIHNAITNHGGIIPATQMQSSQMGNLFVRAGDGHFCPKCKCWSTVIKSHDHVIFDGKPVAYVGDKLTCGATIQPQQSHVVGESGSPYSNKENQSSSTNEKFDEQLKIVFDSDIPDIFKYIDCRIKVGETFQEGKLDLNGNTTRFHTKKQEPITEIEFIFKDGIIYFHDL